MWPLVHSDSRRHRRAESGQIVLKRRGRLCLDRSASPVKCGCVFFPDKPFTQKPAEVKMGKGKGDLAGYEAVIRPGRIMFEIDGVDEATAREALRKAGTKLPVKTRVVSRDVR